jgi:hypothetical protein
MKKSLAEDNTRLEKLKFLPNGKGSGIRNLLGVLKVSLTAHKSNDEIVKIKIIFSYPSCLKY